MILAQEIKKLRLLDADWDGEGALPVDTNVIEHIKTFCRQLKTHGLHLPQQISALGDGGVCLSWRTTKSRVILFFKCNDPLIYLSESRECKPCSLRKLNVEDTICALASSFQV